MLAGMSSTEYADGTAFTVPIIFMMFCWICTFPADVHRAQPVFQRSGYASAGFSLLNRREADEEPEDDVLMQKRQGLPEAFVLARTGMKLSPFPGCGGHDGG